MGRGGGLRSINFDILYILINNYSLEAVDVVERLLLPADSCPRQEPKSLRFVFKTGKNENCLFDLMPMCIPLLCMFCENFTKKPLIFKDLATA